MGVGYIAGLFEGLSHATMSTAAIRIYKLTFVSRSQTFVQIITYRNIALITSSVLPGP